MLHPVMTPTRHTSGIIIGKRRKGAHVEFQDPRGCCGTQDAGCLLRLQQSLPQISHTLSLVPRPAFPLLSLLSPFFCARAAFQKRRAAPEWHSLPSDARACLRRIGAGSGVFCAGIAASVGPVARHTTCPPGSVQHQDEDARHAHPDAVHVDNLLPRGHHHGLLDHG